MAKVTFETAALADAIKRANSVAPTKGKELDLYKGFYFEVMPDSDGVFLRATNGEIFYQEWLMPLKIEGEYDEWRLPSPSINGIVSNLPFGVGKSVIFDNEDNRRMRITSDRMRASVPMMIAESFPDWDDFDDSELKIVHQFGTKLDQVAWAASNTGLPPLCGIYIDSTQFIATNRARLSCVPIDIDLGEKKKIVVPISALSSMVRSYDEVKVGTDDSHLLLSPVEDVHIKCILYADDYPPVQIIMDRVSKLENTILFDKDLVSQILTRIKTIGNTDRQAMMEVRIGKEQVSFFMQDTTSGEEIEESAYLAGQCDHDILSVGFAIDNFHSAINNSPSKAIAMSYNFSEKEPVLLAGGSEYKVILMPRAKQAAT